MEKDLFQIYGSNDIYFTLEMWALLSPRLAKPRTNNVLPETGVKAGQQTEHKPADIVEPLDTSLI